MMISLSSLWRRYRWWIDDDLESLGLRLTSDECWDLSVLFCRCITSVETKFHNLASRESKTKFQVEIVEWRVTRLLTYIISSEFLELESYLHGFHESKFDSFLFIFWNTSHIFLVLIYVDDLIVTGTNTTLMSYFIFALSSFFPIKDLGHLHYFLGIEELVHWTKQGLFMSQSRYISNLLIKSNMHNAKPVANPMFTTIKLIALDGVTFDDP